MEEKKQKKRTQLNNYTVSVFYQLNGMEDMFFFENIPICCGNRINAKKYAKLDFLDSWKDNVGIEVKECDDSEMILAFSHYGIKDTIQTVKDPGVEIVEICIYEDPVIQATEHVLELNRVADSIVERQNAKVRRELEEKERQMDEWLEFLNDIPSVYADLFRTNGINNLNDLEHLSRFAIYRMSFEAGIELKSYIELMKRLSRKAIYFYPHKNDPWIDKKIDVINQYEFSDHKDTKEVLTSTILNDIDVPKPLKETYNEGLLPDYLSQFQFYSRDELLSKPGIGKASIDWLELHLERNGYKLKKDQ